LLCISHNKLPAGNPEPDRFLAGKNPAEKATPETITFRAPLKIDFTFGFKTDFWGEVDFPIASKQSLLRTLIVLENLFTRLKYV
jgi:hypothetical protein